MDILRKLILRDHPDYDFERYSYRTGDIVNNIVNSSKVLVIESAIDYVECIVIKRGFGVNKGEVLKVNYTDLEYFKNGEYTKPEYTFTRSLRYEDGDIIKDNGIAFCVISRDNEYLTAMALEEVKDRGVYIGANYSLRDPYWEYHYTITREC